MSVRTSDGLPVMDSESIKRALEELQLIQFSLLPDEHLTFLDDTAGWKNALDRYSEDPSASYPPFHDMPSIGIRLDHANIRFELTLGKHGSDTLTSVKGEDITRKDQERWQCLASEKISEISDSEYVALFRPITYLSLTL